MNSFSLDFSDKALQPLAAKMRPQALLDFVGQRHILGEGKPLRKAIEAGYLHSMILWGAPGTGKTTLAELIANTANAVVIKISAVTSGVKEIRDAINQAKQNQQVGRRTLLFVDEVHRFNKSQQDAFLPHIEDGTIVFIGATTENPSFELNAALLSRAKVYRLKALTSEDISAIIMQALTDKIRGYGDKKIEFQEDAKAQLIAFANGDARRSLNILEMLIDVAEPNENELIIVTPADLDEVVGEKIARFDKQGDRFYDFISAFHKSVRGSSPDGALYWYARIITAGGDPLYVARRLLAVASEDIGNADPRAMQVALAAWDCFVRVGAAEGERAIAQAAVYLACAPKSNAVYSAFGAAVSDAKNCPDYDVPPHLCNAPTELMKGMGLGKTYRYAHNEPNAYAAGESYFPEALSTTRYYYPTDRGLEKQIAEKLTWLYDQDAQSKNKRYK